MFCFKFNLIAKPGPVIGMYKAERASRLGPLTPVYHLRLILRVGISLGCCCCYMHVDICIYMRLYKFLISKIKLN